MAKLWGGRFDKRLYKQDIVGSVVEILTILWNSVHLIKVENNFRESL